MPIFTMIPKFIYPKSTQFPFDDIVTKIVLAIRERNWEVPGITLKFETYGSGESKFRMVRDILGEDFKLHFSRIQGKLDNSWNDTAAVSELCIPKQILEVYEDESGPTYYLYVGEDWDADKENFMNSLKVHSKLDRKPRTYLQYKGDRDCRRAINLIADNDLGREYDPQGDEPQMIPFSEVMDGFIEWLGKNALDYILSFPTVESSELVELSGPVEDIIPYIGPWPLVYGICDWREAERIQKGKENPSDLDRDCRHASFGSGRRLVFLGVQHDGKFPKVAYDGFIWCDTNQELSKDSGFRDLAAYIRSNSTGDHLVAINIKYANHIYVADHAEYDETRERLFEKIAPRERLTEAEIGEAYIARANTIIPIVDYKGGYKRPIVLINRELDFDEIEWISES